MAIALRKFLFSSDIFSVIRNTPSSLSCLIPNYTRLQYSNGKAQAQEIVPDYKVIEDELSQKVFDKVNEKITNKSHGRLFAVVQVQGIQYKVTAEDIIVIRHSWAPTLGDKIRLEKVLLVGCSDFTLIGRPLLPKDQVSVTASIIEKTLSHTIPYLTYAPRKNNLKKHFYKDEMTYVRINSIKIMGKVNELGDTDGLRDRIF